MTKLKIALLLVICILSKVSSAQISPPGLGAAHTADWLALGVRQDLDSLKKWQSMSYIGLGRKSSLANYNPLAKSSILVLNQEFYYKFHPHWQTSFALSYRHQNEYSDSYPYEPENPAFEQEFRLYSRISYVLETPRFKLVPTFRQEFRKFYTPTFTRGAETFQFRSRLRLQLTVNLDAAKVHRLIVSSEQLFSASDLSFPNHWTRLGYRESRFVGYYSVAPKAFPLIFDFGYMANWLGGPSPAVVHYAALDIIWKNPFGHHRPNRRASFKQ
ncbi:DUF2490 domain-containing protein [Hymenobacter setariae]|uniref:DUF2490 domain-containing protein n=1 Tax=Hymenobacter setariae TaxID=2594794 RepID=A0A558C448_9BACT|nr:DUF2490 domain-containing protein [Hymenobacter setariae]TVT43467.1 DUF2490 domain-containing protein [Hymenobacter setariae]